MTAYTQTVIAKLSLAGCTPATLWDDATYSKWDVAFWDDGTRDIPNVIGKLISESEAATDTIIKFPTILRSESETITDGVVKTPAPVYGDTITPTGGIGFEYKYDGTLVWNYDFPDYVTNFESMSTASYTSSTNNSATWTTVTTNVVGWS